MEIIDKSCENYGARDTIYTNIVNVRFVYLRKYIALLLFPLHFRISQLVCGYVGVDCMSYNIGQNVCLCVCVCNTLLCMSSHSQIRCNIICKIYRLYIRFTGCQMLSWCRMYDVTGSIAWGDWMGFGMRRNVALLRLSAVIMWDFKFILY